MPIRFIYFEKIDHHRRADHLTGKAGRAASGQDGDPHLGGEAHRGPRRLRPIAAGPRRAARSGKGWHRWNTASECRDRSRTSARVSRSRRSRRRSRTAEEVIAASSQAIMAVGRRSWKTRDCTAHALPFATRVRGERPLAPCNRRNGAYDRVRGSGFLSRPFSPRFDRCEDSSRSPP